MPKPAHRLSRRIHIATDCNRRQFVSHTAALSTLALVGGPLPANAQEAAKASEVVAGKDPGLIVHSPVPGQMETPFELLRGETLTPARLLFVRNNQFKPEWMTLEPLPLTGWKIEFTGLLNQPAVLDAGKLAELQQTDIEMVLQCSGNGRAFFGQAAPVKGTPWSLGAVGNVRFGGVRLSTVFKSLGLEPHPAARFITGEGSDKPAAAGEPDFEHSLPLDDVLSHALLATRLNGQPLPAVHGGPVRLVMPGYYGTMHIKWLSRLRLSVRETANHHQAHRYRTPLAPIKPGTPFRYALNNSEPNWHMRTKSLIFAPLNGEQLAAGMTAVRGVAWNDGRAPITAVELSIDDGRHWRQTEVKKPASPYAWYPWESRLMLPKGRSTLLARAIDALGRTQPTDGSIFWNPSGYTWNGLHTVSVQVG